MAGLAGIGDAGVELAQLTAIGQYYALRLIQRSTQCLRVLAEAAILANLGKCRLCLVGQQAQRLQSSLLLRRRAGSTCVGSQRA